MNQFFLYNIKLLNFDWYAIYKTSYIYCVMTSEDVGCFSLTEKIDVNYLNKKCAFWKVYTEVYNHTWRDSIWCFGEQLKMEQNDNLGESNENFPILYSRRQRQFKTHRGTLQHMWFCKENHAIDEGEGTGTIIGTQPDNEMKYREEIENAFNELVHWKRNLFDLPKGAPGKAFINELTFKINEWCSKSPNWDICLKALMVMPSLILQRTSNKCKMSKIKSHIERRLNHWKNKDVEGLLNETRTIQKRLSHRQKPQSTEEKARIFAKLVLEGKVNAAIRVLNDDTSSGVLPLLDDVKKTIRQKHPDAKTSNDTMILHGPFNHVNETRFNGINDDLVRKCVIRTKGSHGPSGLDACVIQPLGMYQMISVTL